MKLTSVTLPMTLDGETMPPCQQNLAKDELREKELVCSTVHSIPSTGTGQEQFDGYVVHSTSIPCNDALSLLNDIQSVDNALKAGVRQLESEESLKIIRAELEMLTR